MNSSDFETFLKNSGNAYEAEPTERGKRFYFTDRSCHFFGIAYDDDPAFLHLLSRFDVPPNLANGANLESIARDLDDEYPVVKVKAVTTDKDAYFEVATEQYEASPEAAEAVFWRTLDLMRAVGEDCYRRLGPPEQKTAPAKDVAEFVDHVEALLKKGCEQREPAAVTTATGMIRHSLALVMDDEGSTASAFCVASDSSRSVFITNAHVVADKTMVTLYRQCPSYEKITGTVIAVAEPSGPDLALISVSEPAIPAAKLSPIAPAAESQVALIGYARVQLWAADTIGELLPAVHFGTLTAVNQDGSSILHDALSRPGDSGGPLFDPRTGAVVGVERGGWDAENESIAIGRDAIVAFLSAHGVILDGSSS